jgi:hypothetical protein
VKTLDEVIESTKELPEELQTEVRDFARYLRDTRTPKPAGRMKLMWRGALRGLRDRYTSVELQHKILDCWIEAALDGCPSAEAIRCELRAVGSADRNGSGDSGRDTASTTDARQHPFYNWFGLDNALMYAAHKAAGGMTSIYRQIGIGCEHLFRAVLQDELGLTQDEASWSYSVRSARGKRRTLSLDGRIPIDAVRDSAARSRVKDWIHGVCRELGVNPRIARSLSGIVFEVRQGYKSKDSKRQIADLANAATAYSQAYLPCVALLSMQMDDDIFTRYKAAKWAMLTGRTQGGTSQDRRTTSCGKSWATTLPTSSCATRENSRPKSIVCWKPC